MPFGFTEYRLKKGIKPQTVKFQVITINQFLSYLDLKYPGKKLEPFEFKRTDIIDFLNQQLHEKKLDESTVYKKQSTLNIFFNFLYKTNQISIDPMEKLNLFEKEDIYKIIKKKSYIEKVNFDYVSLLEKRNELFKMDKVSLKTQLVFILVLKGIQLSDMYKLTINDFIKDKEGNHLLVFTTKFKKESIIIFEHPKEQEIIAEALHIARERNTPYILHTKKSNGEYVPSEPLNTRYCFTTLRDLLNISIRSEHIRLAYIHYLYYHKNFTALEISGILGRPIRNIFKLIDESLERIENTNYNVIRASKEDLILTYQQNRVDIDNSSEQLNLFNL